MYLFNCQLVHRQTTSNVGIPSVVSETQAKSVYQKFGHYVHYKPNKNSKDRLTPLIHTLVVSPILPTAHLIHPSLILKIPTNGAHDAFFEHGFGLPT